MSYFRSYFEKNNTLVKDSLVNTSKNPTTEIFYGSRFSKFIFKIDFEELINKVNSNELLITTGTTHTLHLTNTIFGDETFLGAKRGTGKQRTNSFDLILFKINEFWDEGLGFDYEDGGYDFTTGNVTYDERPSNWFNRTTLNSWTSDGIYTDSPTILSGSTHTTGLIHFDNGNEDIKIDVTDYVNGILTGNTDHGVGLAFAVAYQEVTAEVEQSVAFFTKYTQTFFEPYVESFFDDRIEDNRYDFTEKINQNLYLYISKDGNFVDLDNEPTVDILDSSKTSIVGLTDLTTTKIKKGVYKVTFGLDGVICDGKRFFYDKWKNLVIDGVSVSDVTQKFIPKSFTTQYSIGENLTELERYSIQFFGIKQNEKVLRGEKRKIVINFRSINNPKNTILNDVYYRLYIKEGRTNVIVHDWTLVDKTNENSFFLDTSFYVPREYFMEIKGKTFNEEIFYDEIIKFEILSEK
jgi:hypothetical protein